MIDFPIGELLDDSICLIWLERHLHAEGFTCPRCGSTERRLFREQGYFPAYHCRACDGDYTLLTGTLFANTQPRPATLVLGQRGMAIGEAAAVPLCERHGWRYRPIFRARKTHAGRAICVSHAEGMGSLRSSRQEVQAC